MGNYNLSGRAQLDLIGIYKYSIKYFGRKQATEYLHELEKVLEWLPDRPELAKDCSYLAHQLKQYRFGSHVIFFKIDEDDTNFVVGVLGKRMDFASHL